MPIGDAYATATTYRALLSKTDTSEDAEILDDLTSVSRWMERTFGRHFTQDAAVVARTYYVGRELGLGRTARELWIPDVATKTGFVLKRDDDQDGVFTDETAWTIDTDFQLLPLNAADEPEAQPWTEIFIPTWSSQELFAVGDYLQITSKKGWPAIPKAVERACCHLTAILRLESPRATERVPEDIDKTFAMSPSAAGIIRELARGYARSARAVFA